MFDVSATPDSSLLSLNIDPGVSKRLHDPQGLLDNFRTDAVTGKYCDFHDCSVNRRTTSRKTIAQTCSDRVWLTIAGAASHASIR